MGHGEKTSLIYFIIVFITIIRAEYHQYCEIRNVIKANEYICTEKTAKVIGPNGNQ